MSLKEATLLSLEVGRLVWITASTFILGKAFTAGFVFLVTSQTF